MHNFHPLVSTVKSDDQAMAAVGMMPLGPEFPENSTPFTVSTSKYDSVSKLSTVMGAARFEAISMVQA
jgi:hypothetical protein